MVGHDGHNERLIASIIYKAAEWRKTDLRREGKTKQKQRSTTAREREKNKSGAEGANEDMEDEVMDLIAQVQLKVTVQLESRLRDMKAATNGTLFPQETARL